MPQIIKQIRRAETTFAVRYLGSFMLPLCMYHFSCLCLLAATSLRKPHDGSDAFLRYKRTERGYKATFCPAVAQGQVKPCTKPSRQTYRNSGRQKVNGFMCLSWDAPRVMENWAFIPLIWLNLIVSMLFFIVNMQCLYNKKGRQKRKYFHFYAV